MWFWQFNEYILSKITMVLYDCHVNVTQDCHQFIKLFQKSVHIPCFCKVYINCSSQFILEKYFNICIQVLRGKFSVQMQDKQISIPILHYGILCKSSSLFIEDHRPLGRNSLWSIALLALRLQKAPWKKPLSHCDFQNVILPNAKGNEAEMIRYCSEQCNWLHCTSEVWGRNALYSAVYFWVRPMKFFEALLKQFWIWNIFRTYLLHFSKLDTTYSLTPVREQWEGLSMQWLSTLIEKTRGCCNNCPERLERKQDSMLTA